MDKKLYKLMNWPKIESVVYSEEDHPDEILGAKSVSGGTLIQTFQPGASDVFLFDEEDQVEYRMEEADEEGYYAYFLPKKNLKHYKFTIIGKDKEERDVIDPYRFHTYIKKADTDKFLLGVHHEIYKILGAHRMVLEGVEGVSFAVWAPNAIRVSVIGDFNNWDGRVHQMSRLWDSGIFWIFIPELAENTCYQYEIKTKSREILMKADPYEFQHELRPGKKSIVIPQDHFVWEDKEFLKKRSKNNIAKEPASIYEMHFEPTGEASFPNYRDLVQVVLDQFKKMHYTHLELMGIMEHPLDESLGYQVIGYYAPTARYGSPEDFQYFMNEMHKANIPVIIDWVPARFPGDEYGLSYFDGTHLYDYEDPRKGIRQDIGTYVFDYGRKEVINYLLGSALFWLDQYHIDGLRIDDLSSMIYLDYGRTPENSSVNIYGTNENLEAIEFIKYFNTTIHKKFPGVLTIAQELAGYQNVTLSTKDEGLGFDLKWNKTMVNDVMKYFSFDPYFRAHHHTELTFSMIYQYCERYLIALSHEEAQSGAASIYGKMPGSQETKYANMRALYTYFMMHPGKKMIFSANAKAQKTPWNVKEYGVFSVESTFEMFLADLNRFYQANPALFQYDFEQSGFQWINEINAAENLLIFERNSDDETLLIVAHFANVLRNNYRIGVEKEGKYKEVFCSDAIEYGGSGNCNPRVKTSSEVVCDDKKNSIKITLAPLSVHVFQYTKIEKKVD